LINFQSVQNYTSSIRYVTTHAELSHCYSAVDKAECKPAS